MANAPRSARPSARPLKSAPAPGRRGRVLATSVAGALAGLAAGTSGDVLVPQAGRDVTSGRTSTSAISTGDAVARQTGLVRPGVAAVLAPASAAGIQRGRREDGEEGPP